MSNPKVSGNTIVQSTGRCASGVIGAPSLIQGITMTLEHLQHTAPSRTRLVAATAAALAIGLSVFSTPSYSQTMTISDGETTLAQATSKQRVRGEDRSIRPFKADIPQAQIDDLRRRIKATRFPESETVDDFSQGVQLAKLKPLVEYWGTKYDWRKAEARLNALPQFVTNIDGLDIHFIHVRSRHPNALPMLMPHGWPGSVFELLKVVDPLVNPTAHGGRAEDAFHLVLPSLPGYGFSGKPKQATTWGPDQMGRAFHELMQRLGYNEYVAQGGDWGAIISEVMAVQAPKGLLGIHINMPGTVSPSVLDLIRLRQPAPAT
jgi:Epoxide hydrolase N terminus